LICLAQSSDADEDKHCFLAHKAQIEPIDNDLQPQPPTNMLFNNKIALVLASAHLAAASSLRAVSFLLVAAVMVYVSRR